MKELYVEQLFTMDNGEDFLIDVVVEVGEVTEIYASEDIKYKNYLFQKGEQINVNGDESMIRSEDIIISELKK